MADADVVADCCPIPEEIRNLRRSIRACSSLLAERQLRLLLGTINRMNDKLGTHWDQRVIGIKYRFMEKTAQHRSTHLCDLLLVLQIAFISFKFPMNRV